MTRSRKNGGTALSGFGRLEISGRRLPTVPRANDSWQRRPVQCRRLRAHDTGDRCEWCHGPLVDPSEIRGSSHRPLRCSLDAPLPPPPTVAEQKAVITKHYQLACEVYSAKRAVRQLRKFGMRYADWHPEGDAVRAAFIKVSTPSQWHAVLEPGYSIDAAGTYPANPGLPKAPAQPPEDRPPTMGNQAK